ncbi:MAG: electron transport complex subunit RsxC [Candidatus Hadarchaeales archaeon]
MSGFRGGVHPGGLKLTGLKRIEAPPLPPRVVIPLRQHLGAPCDPLVEKGAQVKTGQKIGESKAPVSAPVHASVSGTVVELSPRRLPTGDKALSVVIDSDGKDEWVRMPPLDPEKASREELLQRVREAGIVGMGGAGFPTHIKLNPPKKVDTLLINGVECEPYITSDHRLMLEEGEKIVEGAKIMAKMLGVERVLIAIEDNKPDALEHMKKLSEGWGEVVKLRTKYPQGDERHLLKAVLGREVPAGGLPLDVGAVVQNVATSKAVYDAVRLGIPLVERIVTVTGAVAEPKNLRVRVGTPFTYLLQHCGGVVGKVVKVVAGGPMMGFAVHEEVPVVKTTGCVLLMEEREVREEEESPCIRCGRCVDACPMGLMPTHLVKLVRAKDFDACLQYNLPSCDECGCCAYVCPSKIPIVHVIREGKKGIRRLKK